MRVTTERRFSPAISSPLTPSPTNEEAEIAARALLRAFLVEQIERRRRPSAKLGFSQIDYGRLFIRDRWTLFAIARECGCTVEELVEPPQPSSESRVAWSDLVAASESVMDSARSLRDPLREITLLRAAGLGWRKIQRLHPGRAPFSLADDFAEAVRKVWILSSRDCRLLAFSDHPKFIVVKTRSAC